MEGKKRGNRSSLCMCTLNSISVCLYMAIHFHQGQTQRLQWATDCALLTQWHMSAISVSHSLLLSISTTLSLLSFSLSTSIASSGLYKPPISTASETLALTWLPGGKASPGRDASDHKGPTPICQAAHFKILYFTSGVKKNSNKKKKKGRGWCLFLLPLMAINDH